MAEQKKCIFCKRTIVGKSKLGVCANCVNKGGQGVAAGAAGIGTVLVAGKLIINLAKKIKK